MKAIGPRVASVALLILVATACDRGKSLSQTELGRVVVYRNGVAYFERVATVEDGQISLLVAKAKVDDLLKSLTVKDAKTGETLPISFPARQVSGELVKMTVRVNSQEPRKVRISYVAESPAWKPSYRLNLLDDGKVALYGWAIVDNVSGEDWKDVLVGVGSTSALSFRYDLWTVRDVRRQTLTHRQHLATAPPTATGLAAGARSKTNGSTTTRSVTLNSDYTKNIPVPGRSFESALESAAGASDDGIGISFSGSTSLDNQYVIDGVNSSGLSLGSSAKRRRSAKEIAVEKERKAFYQRQRQQARAERAKVERQNAALASQILESDGSFVIEGIASPSETNGDAVALSMANHVRNDLISRGVPPSRLVTRTRVGAVGEPTTLRVAALEAEPGNPETDSPEGESKFMSATPLSIPHDGTSMVSILNEPTAGEVVYLYDPDSVRGNKSYAFRAVKFDNPTTQYLEGGPVTVFGDDTFVGEGLIDSIAPGASAILPFGLDKQVHIEREQSFDDAIVRFKGSIGLGAIVSARRRSRTHFSLHNRSQEAVTVFIRHDSDAGWKVTKAPKGMGRLGRMTVFPVKLAAGARETVSVLEHTPITLTLDLTQQEGVTRLERYLRVSGETSPFATSARKLIESHRSISQKLAKLDQVAGQLVIYRNRAEQLHFQLLSLEAVKSRGRMRRDLDRRMERMSTRVEKAIVAIVQLQEEIMLERFAYHDLVIATLTSTSAGAVTSQALPTPRK